MSYKVQPTDAAMMFIDGTNLLIEMFSRNGLSLLAESAHDHAFRVAAKTLRRAERTLFDRLGPHRMIRRYWFGSVQGSNESIASAAATLRQSAMEAVLFPKRKGREGKGVDLAVAREMLMHAFNGNCSTVILVAGDADYVELVRDVKRLGVSVAGAFYRGESLAPRLEVAFDHFVELEELQAIAPESISELKKLEASGKPVKSDSPHS